MPIWKIAAGVFIGNLLFGLLAWFVVAIHADNVQAEAMGAQANAQLEALRAEEAASNASSRP